MRLLGKERRPPAEDIRTDQVFDGIQQFWVPHHVAEPGEGQLGFDAESILWLVADGVLQRLNLAASSVASSGA